MRFSGLSDYESDYQIKNVHPLIPFLGIEPDCWGPYNYSQVDIYHIEMQLFDIVLVDIVPVFLVACRNLFLLELEEVPLLAQT